MLAKPVSMPEKDFTNIEILFILFFKLKNQMKTFI